MGCPSYEADEDVFSTKYRKLFYGEESPQFTVHDMEQQVYQTKVDPVNLFDQSDNINLIGFCTDTRQAKQHKKDSLLQFWIATFDKFDATCHEGTTSLEAEEKLIQEANDLRDLSSGRVIDAFVVIKLIIIAAYFVLNL